MEDAASNIDVVLSILIKVIGLTKVAFVQSAPELVVNLMAAVLKNTFFKSTILT
uniref:hypothetical protein n=1 Tax=Salinimicrobium sediminilitoris TaxID=2876715 RepID=UPI0038CD724B